MGVCMAAPQPTAPHPALRHRLLAAPPSCLCGVTCSNTPCHQVSVILPIFHSLTEWNLHRTATLLQGTGRSQWQGDTWDTMGTREHQGPGRARGSHPSPSLSPQPLSHKGSTPWPPGSFPRDLPCVPQSLSGSQLPWAPLCLPLRLPRGQGLGSLLCISSGRLAVTAVFLEPDRGGGCATLGTF